MSYVKLSAFSEEFLYKTEIALKITPTKKEKETGKINFNNILSLIDLKHYFNM